MYLEHENITCPYCQNRIALSLDVSFDLDVDIDNSTFRNYKTDNHGFNNVELYVYQPELTLFNGYDANKYEEFTSNGKTLYINNASLFTFFPFLGAISSKAADLTKYMKILEILNGVKVICKPQKANNVFVLMKTELGELVQINRWFLDICFGKSEDCIFYVAKPEKRGTFVLCYVGAEFLALTTVYNEIIPELDAAEVKD